MAAQVTETGNSMVAGKIEALFPVSPTSSSLAIYDVAPDAKKFLITSISANRKPEPLTVVSNWTALLPK